MKILMLLVLASLLGGCAHMPGEDTSQPVSQSGAVESLYQQGEQHRKAGNLALAQASFERALRIEPNNAQLWYELAQLAREQNETTKAKELALRAQSLAGEDRSLQRQIKRLLRRLN